MEGIAGDFAYLGLVLVVDSVSQQRSWAATANFTPHQIISASGDTPDLALEDLVAAAQDEKLHLPLPTSLDLQPIAEDLLQLVVRPADSAPDGASTWIAIARFRRKGLLGRPRTITITAAQPDSALTQLLREAMRG